MLASLNVATTRPRSRSWSLRPPTCSRCGSRMQEVATIAPFGDQPGLTAYQCPKCGQHRAWWKRRAPTLETDILVGPGGPEDRERYYQNRVSLGKRGPKRFARPLIRNPALGSRLQVNMLTKNRSAKNSESANKNKQSAIHPIASSSTSSNTSMGLSGGPG